MEQAQNFMGRGCCGAQWTTTHYFHSYNAYLSEKYSQMLAIWLCLHEGGSGNVWSSLKLEVTFNKEGSLWMLGAMQVEDIDVSGISNNNSGCKISVPDKDKISFVMRIYGDSIKCIAMYKLSSKYCVLLPYSNRKTCFQIIKDKSLGATQFSPASSS